MANPEHLAILKKGVETWNNWRKHNPSFEPYLLRADLSGMCLVGADLRRANLFDADLSEADLSNCVLHSADLVNSDLTCAVLCGARLRGANLLCANLLHSDFSNAFLLDADFSGAKLGGANFTGARIGVTALGNVDLSEVKGLESVIHQYPSSLGIDTFYKSKGKIPEVFLRGCGVPDSFIRAIPALLAAAKPIELFSVFISHSNEDEGFTEKLHDYLQRKGVRCWYFKKSARWGESIWGEINRGIMGCDKVVLVCSENSLQSGPVLRELERTLQREDTEGKIFLCPIRLDDYVFKDWQHERKADVTKPVIGDFREWKIPAAFENACTVLLERLQAPAKPPALGRP